MTVAQICRHRGVIRRNWDWPRSWSKALTIPSYREHSHRGCDFQGSMPSTQMSIELAFNSHLGTEEVDFLPPFPTLRPTGLTRSSQGLRHAELVQAQSFPLLYVKVMSLIERAESQPFPPRCPPLRSDIRGWRLWALTLATLSGWATIFGGTVFTGKHQGMGTGLTFRCRRASMFS